MTDIATLQTQINRVRRLNTLLAVLVVVILLTAMTHSRRLDDDLVLHDDDGVERVRLSRGVVGNAGLFVFDKTGKRRLALGLDDEGHPGIMLRGRGQGGITIGEGDDGSLTVRIGHDNGEPAIVLCRSTGSVSFTLSNDQPSGHSLAFGADTDHSFVRCANKDTSAVDIVCDKNGAGLSLSDNNARPRARLTAVGSKLPYFSMLGSDGSTRLAIAVDASENGKLVFSAQEGAPILAIGHTPGSGAGVAFFGPKDLLRMTLGIDGQGKPRLGAFHRSGSEGFSVVEDAAGRYAIVMLDAEGKPVFRVP